MSVHKVLQNILVTSTMSYQYLEEHGICIWEKCFDGFQLQGTHCAKCGNYLDRLMYFGFDLCDSILCKCDEDHKLDDYEYDYY